MKQKVWEDSTLFSTAPQLSINSSKLADFFPRGGKFTILHSLSS
jgi:hypothetical protein